MQNEIVLIADPRVLNIPICENNEPLVDLKNQTAILYGPSPEIENNLTYTRVRRTVYDKLVVAQDRLPAGIRLCLYEGLRTLSLQLFLFQDRWDKVRTYHPDWTDLQVYQEVIKLVSPVETLEGTINIPPHSTGAAVDVYLVDQNGKTLEMGILTKDWTKDMDGNLSLTQSILISEEARANRRLLSEVMKAAGFVNYPTEYWHWSYGDRYWAFEKNEPFAIYGTAPQSTSALRD